MPCWRNRSHLLAIQSRQHDIQENNVVMLIEGQVKSGLTITDVIADDAADLQVLDDGGSQVQIVLDQQQMNMHGKNPSGRQCAAV